MARVLVHSEKTELIFELLTAARLIDKDAAIATVNDNEQAQLAADKGAIVYLIKKVNLVDAGEVAVALSKAAESIGADVVMLSSDRRGKELAGRVAQQLGAGCLTDVRKIQVVDDKIRCERNALGGATIATQEFASEKKVIAVSPKSYEPCDGGMPGSIRDMEVDVKSFGVSLVESKPKEVESINIEDAKVLIVAGQGVENQSDLTEIEAIARALGGEVACSKPVATDKKWMPEERIIGLSGKICKPDLAILFGISGQVQFTVGIRDSKTIVSINKDENADICNMSDYIFVAEINEILSKLKTALN